ncbi:hypothetical protein Pfo_020283 [Paulownia fortunei]|nr:hypothetical protein Pfo_020283 [Paulownia fortunei]
MIVLGCMDLDLALRIERPPTLTDESSSEAKRDLEKWDCSNRMSLMIMKRSIPETFKGAMSEEDSAKKFLEYIEKRFAKNEKAETSTLLANLVSLRYKGKGNIREYIMEMSNLASKLKALKLELFEDLLVHLVLISLPAQYSQFKVSYNTQKDKWTLNELISHCVQEEERIKREMTESAHLAATPQNKKRKKENETAVGTPQPKVQKKQDSGFNCYFCRQPGHMKKDFPNMPHGVLRKV